MCVPYRPWSFSNLWDNFCLITKMTVQNVVLADWTWLLLVLTQRVGRRILITGAWELRPQFRWMASSTSRSARFVSILMHITCIQIICIYSKGLIGAEFELKMFVSYFFENGATTIANGARYRTAVNNVSFDRTGWYGYWWYCVLSALRRYLSLTENYYGPMDVLHQRFDGRVVSRDKCWQALMNVRYNSLRLLTNFGVILKLRIYVSTTKRLDEVKVNIANIILQIQPNF